MTTSGGSTAIAGASHVGDAEGTGKSVGAPAGTPTLLPHRQPDLLWKDRRVGQPSPLGRRPSNVRPNARSFAKNRHRGTVRLIPSVPQR